jgi:hypothetical protein
MRYGHLVMSIFCAWVMWQQEQVISQGRTTSTWEIIGAEEVHEKCRQWTLIAAKNLEGNLKGRGKLISDTAVAIDAEMTIYMFKCIPDTIDPGATK